ncbi:MAG: Gfo/Idh/MocA family oxidoreductase [Chthoniobacteraceae bacterium]
MTTPSKVRLAIIGAGGISGAHAEGILQHHDKVECVALCDVSAENLENRARQLGGAPAKFNDWNEMYRVAGGWIDAVVICLPHKLHAPAIMDAAKNGKHILCEKPMCISLDEAGQIESAVKAAGIIYMSAHNQLFTPIVQEMKKLIASGRIGQLRWLRSQDLFIVGGSGTGFKGQWRASLATQGGGELIDTGYHPSYRLLYLVDSPIAEIRATMGRFEQQIEGEDTASVQVRFQNGVIGEILTSWAMQFPYGSHEVHAIGSEGQLFGTGSDLYYLPRGFQEPAKLKLPEIKSTFVEQMECFARCIANGEKPPHGVEEGKAVLELILNATKNADGWQATAPVKP